MRLSILQSIFMWIQLLMNQGVEDLVTFEPVVTSIKVSVVSEFFFIFIFIEMWKYPSRVLHEHHKFLTCLEINFIIKWNEINGKGFWYRWFCIFWKESPMRWKKVVVLCYECFVYLKLKNEFEDIYRLWFVWMLEKLNLIYLYIIISVQVKCSLSFW